MYNASYSWSGPQLPKGCGFTGFLSPVHKKIPDSYLKREGGNPKNSGLLSQQKMVVHYPSTVRKNSYAEHEVTGKIYNKKKSFKWGTVSDTNVDRYEAMKRYIFTTRRK